MNDVQNVRALQQARLGLLRKTLAEQGISCFYLRNESDIEWLCAFEGVFDHEGAFALLVTADQALLHTDSRYEIAARAAAEGTLVQVDTQQKSHAAVALAEVAAQQEGALAPQDDRAHSAPAAQPFAGASGEYAPSMRMGVETSLTLGEYRKLQAEAQKHAQACSVSFAETDGLCVDLRGVKDAGEIARIKAAQAITDAAFAHIVRFMRPGMTERQVQVELEDYMVRHGAQGLAFTSIVACGAHGASPHAVSGNTRLEAGQCVVLDFGARAQGYCSDMTRVVFLGEPSAEMRHAYAVLREANETVEALLAPGVTGAQAHAKAEEILAAGGYAGKMGHGLGHGVGLDIHEQPNLSPRNSKPLAAGSVVTVEPGIYLEGRFGMRLEDFGVITETGFQVFTQSSHEMVII